MNNENVKFLLNWNHFAEHLVSCMTKLMTDTSYSDIIIATADRRMIYSHRFVLANSSKYFQRLLKHINKPRGMQLVVALPEIRYDIFKILMNYMYKGETQVPHELLPSVIKAGQFLEINGLVNLSENESNSNNESAAKLNSLRDLHPRGSNTHTSISGNERPLERVSSTLRDKTLSRENSSNSKSSSQVEKRGKRQHVNDHQEPGSPKETEENGKENQSKRAKSSKCKNVSQERKDVIQLPLKRKSAMREPIKRASPTPSSSSSVSTESSPTKKVPKLYISKNLFSVRVKDEKEISSCPGPDDDNQNTQDLSEKITIKMEVPDEIEEVVYNELQCEFCHETYTNPSDWVRHMTNQHGDKGFQTFKTINKSVGSSAMIRCVVCSSVCFSASEWATHLRTWHTDRELAAANVAESRKTYSKIKKKTGTNKKEK